MSYIFIQLEIFGKIPWWVAVSLAAETELTPKEKEIADGRNQLAG